jgi:two-component system, LuxR family, sensor kinase FixL
MVLAGRVLNTRSIGACALACAILAEQFDTHPWLPPAGPLRSLLYFATFFSVGYFACEAARNKSLLSHHLLDVEKERDARREAEEQLRMLVETSPAAILSSDSCGAILMANEAAHRLLGVEADRLPGGSIYEFFPSLCDAWKQSAELPLLRAVMQARARREDGETFLADICFSTYSTVAGWRLTALILDASDDLRSSEEASLQQMLAGSCLAVAAASHEIRNISGAISAVHQNLSLTTSMQCNKDFETLGALVKVLERIASVELHQTPLLMTEIDLCASLDDLRIVLAPSLREADIEGHWQIASSLPRVRGDRSALMQVFLNLATNSIRILSGQAGSELFIGTRAEGDRIFVDFIDNGGGVTCPDRLFHPFQPEAKATGLGLYLSRAFMRSFSGELRYHSVPGGAWFEVQLAVTSQEPVQ